MATKKKSTTKAKTKTAAAAKKTTAKTAKKKTSTKVVKKSVKKPAAQQTKAAKSNVKTKNKTPVAPMKKIHVFGALLTAVLAGLVIGYGNDLNVGFTTSYLVENTLTQDGSLLPAIRELFQVNLSYIIAGLLIAAAVWRGLLATKLSETYENQVTKKFTSSNWLELSIFGSLSVAIVSAAVGVRDIMTLILIGGLVAAVAMLGYLTDRYNLIGKDTWFKKSIITKSLLLPWLAIGVSVWHSDLYGFVRFGAGTYSLLLASFVVYLSIAAIHRRQITGNGRFKSFLYGEQIIAWLHLLLLSLVAAIAFV